MYNSDGYVLIDLTGVDITKTNQHLTGIYDRVVSVLDINKLALVINAGSLSPMAAVVHKRLNYYVINTTLYIFTINSNDIIVIEEAGTSTVDVTIVPTLLDGEKIADFAVGATEGSLYAPRQQSEINDSITTDHTTWSSDKIGTQLSSKANAADVYSKSVVDTALSAKANAADVYTKTEVDTALSAKANAADVYTKTEVDTALSAKANAADVYTKTEINNTLSSYQTKNDSTYNVGDTITAGVYKHCAGRTTNAGDKVLFFYSTAKPIGGSCSGASLVIPSNSGQCYTSAGGLFLKGGTYAGTITDGGLYFLVDLETSFTDGGRVATAELQSRTITFL